MHTGNQENVIQALLGMRKLAEEMRNSQRFGQSLPNGTTQKWSEELDRYKAEICREFKIKLPEAASRNPPSFFPRIGGGSIVKM